MNPTREQIMQMASWTLEDLQNDPLGSVEQVRELATAHLSLQQERNAAVRDLENLMHDMRGISFCSYNKLCVTKNCYVHGEGVEACTPTWRGPQKGGEER